MNSPDAILRLVSGAIDALVAAGAPHGGLFPSLLDRRTGTMLQELPPPITGQRMGDRAHLGSNLIHDEALLATMYALGTALGREDYRLAADRYLERFATHCTDTVTGLFPWGEHSFWHLVEDRVGNSYALRDPATARLATHDHLRQAPLWLWEKLWSYSPRCVERFAEGLDYHWKVGEPSEYNRHATIEVRERPARGQPRASDFPRHGGFYILDWAFAYSRTGREDFLQQIRRLLDHWWTKRDARGLLLTQSRTEQEVTAFLGEKAPGQTISHAVSLYEAAAVLDGQVPDLAATMRARAATYVDGFLSAPHDLAEGVFILRSGRGTIDGWEAIPIWGSEYGLWPASYIGLSALCAHRLTGDSRLLQWASAVGERYAAVPFPAGVQVPAMDAGLGLGLLADLFDVTRDRRWLDAGFRLADVLVPIYWGNLAGGAATSQHTTAPLPRGAAGIDWYESQMGPSFLTHGLARLALLAMRPDNCPLGADYTAL